MYNQFRGGPARLNSYHGPKRQLLGNPAGHVPPAWRNANVPAGLPHNANVASGSGTKKVVEVGSKILLSNLPMDVGENEVEVSTSASEHIIPDVLRCLWYEGTLQTDGWSNEGPFHHL